MKGKFPVKCITRIIKEDDGTVTPILFFPEFEVNHGKILSYQHMGQHAEASIQFFWDTKTPKGISKETAQELNALIEEYKAKLDDDEYLVIRTRLHYDDLCWVGKLLDEI